MDAFKATRQHEHMNGSDLRNHLITMKLTPNKSYYHRLKSPFLPLNEPHKK